MIILYCMQCHAVYTMLSPIRPPIAISEPDHLMIKFNVSTLYWHCKR